MNMPKITLTSLFFAELLLSYCHLRKKSKEEVAGKKFLNIRQSIKIVDVFLIL